MVNNRHGEMKSQMSDTTISVMMDLPKQLYDPMKSTDLRSNQPLSLLLPMNEECFLCGFLTTIFHCVLLPLGFANTVSCHN